MNTTKVLWVGRYQEDALLYGFEGSICHYGISNDMTYVINESKGHIIDSLIEIISKMSNETIYYFYNPSLIFYLPKALRGKCIFANNKEIYQWLNNKSISRSWVQQFVKVPPFVVLSSNDVNRKSLRTLFRGYRNFVIQEMISFAGEGTYLYLDNNNIVLNEGLYIASPYFENAISLNVTVMISQLECISFEPSIQVIENIDGKLRYLGSDFIAASYLPKKVLDMIKEASDKLCSYLQELGYRGICGIDFLLYCGEIYFIEFNPRFQGSSFLIERSVSAYGKSIIDINEKCFLGEITFDEKVTIEKIKVPYAYRIFEDRRVIYDKAILHVSTDDSITNYYDVFADIYHLMLPDWKKSIDIQGKIFKGIFERYAKIPVYSILDCTCGIGIQTISLAELGYNVIGSDLSDNELQWAREEASRRGLDIKFINADCRHLEEKISEHFDAIISIDSALPHLVTHENFIMAFHSIYEHLNPGGVFLSSYRDYAALLKERPKLAYPIRFKKEGNREYTIFRRWKWDDNILFSRQYVIEETNVSSTLLTADYKQWAITKEELLSLANEAGFDEVYWISSGDNKLSQPILCLVK